ncbi:MAG TPA: sigma-70 family RNA polymerase sigma factor [Actinomycetota bacterium]
MTPSASEPSDAELVSRARSADDDAFGELVRRHEANVYNLALRMLGRPEDARDAAQDAFVASYRSLKKFRGDSAFGTWLHRIAVNACYDMLRKRSREPVELTEELAGTSSADHSDRSVAAVDVQRALLLVPPEFRAPLIMHDVQGMPYEEIAAALDVPVGTVKSRLHRGRVALGEHMGQVRRPSRGRGEPGPAEPTSKRAAKVSGPARSSERTR